MEKKTALIYMFFILGLVILFHLFIYFEQIPYDKVWAGKLNSVEEMKSFETFSIIINVFMMIIFNIKYKQLESKKRNKAIDIIIWIFALLFGLNTLGNLFAQHTLELIFGTLLTLISTILCVIIVKNENQSH